MTGTTFTWLGHSALRFDTPSGTRLYVDPFLNGNPACPESERSPERCDVIAVTHGHGDHIGDAIAVHQRFSCPVVAQVELRRWLTENGVADDGSAHSINKGGTVTVGDLRLTLTHANHSSTAPDGRNVGESCGFVIRPEGGATIYVAGDTSMSADMALIGRLYKPDVAVLPIGDHYTMGPEEAAIAAELVGAPVVIPCHWGAFPITTGTAAALAPLLPDGIRLLAPEPGETVTL
jgi:L-ascorbate metabolism protein UlaG (beta-lactamase superfamily)